MKNLKELKKIINNFSTEIDELITKQDKLTTKQKIKLEDHNFKIDSSGWKKETNKDGINFLVNPEGDIWELK